MTKARRSGIVISRAGEIPMGLAFRRPWEISDMKEFPVLL